MSDPLRGVAPGESPARLLNATTFNMTMDAVRWFRDHGQAAAGRRGAPAAPDGTNDARLEVRVRAGATLPEWAIINLGAAAIDPDAAPRNANNTPVFEAVAPAAGGVVAVLMQPLASGRIGRACVSGVCVASVNVTDAAHKYAVAVAGDLFALDSAPAGPFRLFTNPGVGTAKCLVMLGEDRAAPNWIYPVRACATGTVTLSAPGSTIDGVTMNAGDRFLVPFVGNGVARGVYIWNGASTAATRAADADSALEVAGSAVAVEEGSTFAGSEWHCEFARSSTLGSGTSPIYRCSVDRVSFNGVVGYPVSQTAREVRFVNPSGFSHDIWSLSTSGSVTTLTPLGLYIGNDASGAPVLSGVQMLRFPAAHFTLTTPATGELQIVPTGGGGTVTSVSGGSPADGVTVSVADGTTTPTITISLGDITPDSVATGAVSGTTGTFSGAVSGSSLAGTYDAGTW